MVSVVSLFPLTAGLLSIFLGALALAGTRPVNRSLRYFVALNVSTALWCLTYFVLLNMPGVTDPAVAPFGSLPHVLAVVEALGVGAAPTYWFLFAASYASRTRWATGRARILAHVPLVYTVVCVATNPLHRLFVVSALPDGSAVYGPLMVPHQIAAYVLIGLGTWLIVSSSWKRGTAEGRRQALVLGAAVLVPAVGGALYAVRGPLGLDIPVHPTPVLFPVLNVALAYELLRAGLADIVPYATMQAFDAISDAAIALDDEGIIAAINAAARDILPDADLGVRLSEVAPDLASAADACLLSAASYAGFDLDRGERVYWGRARPTRDRRGTPMGCILLLTDVTEVRMTQTKLLQLGLEADGRF